MWPRPPGEHFIKLMSFAQAVTNVVPRQCIPASRGVRMPRMANKLGCEMLRFRSAAAIAANQHLASTGQRAIDSLAESRVARRIFRFDFLMVSINDSKESSMYESGSSSSSSRKGLCVAIRSYILAVRWSLHPCVVFIDMTIAFSLKYIMSLLLRAIPATLAKQDRIVGRHEETGLAIHHGRFDSADIRAYHGRPASHRLKRSDPERLIPGVVVIRRLRCSSSAAWHGDASGECYQVAHALGFRDF